MNGGPAITADDWIHQAIDRYHGPLAVYASKLVGRRDAAADVVQEVFLRLCRADRHDVEPKLAQWLYTVCRNLSIDARRREQRMQSLQINSSNGDATDHLPNPSSGLSPADQAERRDTLAQALNLMTHLPPNQQEVLRLKFQHSLSYKEIAAVTGLTETNVGFLIHTGLKTLRQMLLPTPAPL